MEPLIDQRGAKAAAVKKARYNLNNCRVYAPFDARVTNLTISEGAYAHVGQEMFTLIDARTWWAIGNFREGQLKRITPGMKVDVYVLSRPNLRFSGVVDSIGFGVTPDPDVIGHLQPGLPDVQRTLNWVHLASRYPVRVRVDNPTRDLFRIGESAVSHDSGKLRMATAAKTLLEIAFADPWLWTFLKEELAPYPGRTALVARMTVAVTLVMIINMVFRIPYGAYGAIYALIISREDLSTTMNAVRTIIIAFALSVLYILVGALFFLQDPNLRLFWVIATLFLMFYTLSAASDYTAAARFGYLLVITIPVWDRQIRTELESRANTLGVWSNFSRQFDHNRCRADLRRDESSADSSATCCRPYSCCGGSTRLLCCRAPAGRED